ncbi:MAG: efflux RND transporter periplasmic adaptor subunit [Pseudomonadota bacterium]
MRISKPAIKLEQSNAVVLTLGLILACTISACSKPPPATPPTPDVAVLKLIAAPADVTVEYVAQTEAFNATEIRPRVGGLLEKQVAVEGSTIKKGDVLFVIDQQPYLLAISQATAALAQAQAALEQSQRDLARVQPLADANAVSQQELDAVTARNSANKASVAAAESSIKSAKLNLGYSTVTSPIDGIVGRTQLRVGGVVTAYNTLLTTVYATDPMYVNFNVSEQRMLALQARFGSEKNVNSHYADADSFKLLLADGSVFPQRAKLNLVDQKVDQATGTVRIRLEVPNPGHVLRDSQFARVVVTVDHLPAALRVPQRAVQELQGKTSLWMMAADGTVAMRDVQMGERLDDNWLINSGVKAGETVVVDGVQKLKPGIKVNAQPLGEPAKPTTAAAAAGH